MTNENLQWHPAFFAGIQIEFAKEADMLLFESEHTLGTKPKQIDVLIIKKFKNTPIQKNIGRIFRKYNIIEYKSPTDYLSIDDFYLVYAYACLYKSDTNHTDEIHIEDITITFVCSHYPRELVRHLKSIRNYHIDLVEDGIYYVRGDFFPIQILWTKALTDETNLWLHNLQNDIKETEVIEKLLIAYQNHNQEKLYSSVMNIITNANMEKFKEVTGMCEALERIYLEVNGERLERERQEYIEKAVAEKVAERLAEAVAKAVDEVTAQITAQVTATANAKIAEQAAYIKELEAQLALHHI